MYLKDVPRITEIVVTSAGSSDAGLVHVGRLGQLEFLALANAPTGTPNAVTDAGLVHLEGLTNLERLILYRSKVTEEGVKRLQQALPNCRISFTPQGGQQPAKRQTIDGQQGTIAENWAIAAIRYLGGRFQFDEDGTAVVSVNLDRTRVKDADLEKLKSLTSVIELSLRTTVITDAGLVHLEGMKTLRKLNLDGALVSEEGVKRLQQALPNCKIRWSKAEKD